jgi:Tn3 transposase DDE domain
VLTLVTNAVVLFNTVYVQDAVDVLRAEGHAVTDDDASHLSPALSDHVNIYGSLTFDVEREFARTGHRPLRSPDSR